MASPPAPVVASMEDYPELQEPNVTYSEALQAERDRRTKFTNNSKPKKVKMVNHNLNCDIRRLKQKHGQSASVSPRFLKREKLERTTTIYVRTIARYEDKSDDSIENRMRKYVKGKHPVQMISIQVVYNRFCEDTV